MCMPSTSIWGSPAKIARRFCKRPATSAPLGPDRRRPGGTLPRLRLSGLAVAGEVRRRLSAGHVDRPAADLEGLPAGRPRGRGRRLRPRRHRQGQRPVPLPIGGRGPQSGGPHHRPLADREVPPALPRPQRDDRLLQPAEDPRQGDLDQALQLATKTACTSATRRASWKT